MEITMSKMFVFMLLACSFVITPAYAEYYSKKLCQDTAHFSCYTAKKGDKWAKLFPEDTERDLVQRLNRNGIELSRGIKIAIPVNLAQAKIMDFSPFPAQINGTKEKTILVSIDQSAWGAYDIDGKLIQWGPASTAKGYCLDSGPCHTVKGKFEIYHKEGKGCYSHKFPIGHGGAPMPYCMFFHNGYAIHGSNEVPGYNDSHGCVRVYVGDAKWINEEYVKNDKKVAVIVSQN
jgi:L,D-transpeptidase ErfK/SrfK